MEALTLKVVSRGLGFGKVPCEKMVGERQGGGYSSKFQPHLANLLLFISQLES